MTFKQNPLTNSQSVHGSKNEGSEITPGDIDEMFRMIAESGDDNITALL